MPEDLQTTSVGELTFSTDFPVPDVDVKRTLNTKEHQTINDNNVIQVLGDDLPSISIEGVIYADQLPVADNLVGKDPVEVYTHRWSGMAVVKTVDTAFRREADPETGRWIYDLNLDLVGTKEYVDPAQVDEDNSFGGPTGFTRS